MQFDLGVTRFLKSKKSSLKYNKIIKEKTDQCISISAKECYLTVSPIFQSWNGIPMEILLKSYEST